MNSLQQRYVEEIRPQLMTDHGFTSVMQVPKLVKVTLNMGVGKAIADRKLLDGAMDDLTKIAGQKPKITRARKSEAAPQKPFPTPRPEPALRRRAQLKPFARNP